VSTVLLSGASGFIGSALVRSFVGDGHRVVRLSRRETNDGTDVVGWSPEQGWIDDRALGALTPSPHIVMNLAGEPIAQRWTPRRKQAIRDSRVNGTATLAKAVSQLSPAPRVFVSGSAIGYYGTDRGDEQLRETSSPGGDFLARTAMAWEGATAAAARAGVRVVIPRTGVVLGRRGGAMARLLLPFRLGVGGRIGSGMHWMSWISLEDTVRALRFVAETPGIEGPVNVCAPNPVRSRDFTSALGRALHRPTIIPAPAFALRLVFGEMAQATILASQRVVPERLAGAGFEFRHPRVDDALAFELRRSDDRAGR
jgi:uncharacterized protein (TIGR01777 family)